MIDIEVKGLKDAQAEMERIISDLHGPPMLQAFRDSTLLVQRDAKIAAPVDTGRLRASITPEVRTRIGVIEGVVGSNVAYAPHVEFGTYPHWPPPGALAVWARRHHIPEFLVMRSIGDYGTRGRLFLTGAFEKNVDKINAKIGMAVNGIIEDD